VDNYYTFADDYGDVTTYWHGVDFTVNARTRNGITFQGGTSTGRACAITARSPTRFPRLFVTPGRCSRMRSRGVRGDGAVADDVSQLGDDTLPKIDVLLAGSIRSTPKRATSTINTFVAPNGASLPANYNVNSAILLDVQPGASAHARPSFQTVDLTLPGQVYPDRVNSVDLRVAQVLRFGRYSTNVGFDFYNLLNANTGTAFQQGYDRQHRRTSSGCGRRRSSTALRAVQSSPSTSDAVMRKGRSLRRTGPWLMVRGATWSLRGSMSSAS
jgi:hypothetical protein